MIKNGALEEGSQTELNNFYQFFKKYAAADLTNEDNYQAVCDFVDIDSMIEHYAAGIYLGTYDWTTYNFIVMENGGLSLLTTIILWAKPIKILAV